MAISAPEFDELVVSADLQATVDHLYKRGWDNPSILAHLAGQSRSSKLALPGSIALLTTHPQEMGYC